jgi:hypothetical protein
VPGYNKPKQQEYVQGYNKPKQKEYVYVPGYNKHQRSTPINKTKQNKTKRICLRVRI